MKRTAARLALLGGLYLLAACATSAPPAAVKPAADHLVLTPVAFGDLPGWTADRQSEALPAIAKSCVVLARKSTVNLAGSAADWLPICAALSDVPAGDDAAARAFLQRWFTPYAAGTADKDTGLFTGYYEPELQGSREPGGAFQTPLYARPGDLVTVDLGTFLPDLQGKHIAGKVANGRLAVYDDRAAIANGSLAGRAQPLLWVDDPTDAFFLEVQGSGRVRLADGSLVTVGYDAANGRHYTALGGALAARGDIDKPVTMHKIRGWLRDHPDQAQAALDLNASYVFFKLTDGTGPTGAEGVTLTPRRSLAVDPAFVPLGVPLWLDTADGSGAPFRQMMVAQDTGGAIKGAVRGDIFWGFGPDAAAQAGAMQSPGRYDLLLPRTVRVP